MKTRPTGITILSVSFGISTAWMAVLGVLSVFGRPLYESILRGLSPGGSGPEAIHSAMGTLQPLYYLAVAGLCAGVAVGLWRLRNWARLVTLAFVAVSVPGLLISIPSVVQSASAPGLAMFALRLGLCALLGWYLMSRGTRSAFGRVAAT